MEVNIHYIISLILSKVSYGLCLCTAWQAIPFQHLLYFLICKLYSERTTSDNRPLGFGKEDLHSNFKTQPDFLHTLIIDCVN